MGDSTTIFAKTVGNPFDGPWHDPWPSGHPSAGERVAIFAFDVTSVDADAENIRTFHVAPVDLAREWTITPDHADPQGDTVLWKGCGTGTVVRPTTSHDGESGCDVQPDDVRLVVDG